MEKYLKIKAAFETKEDPEKAKKMAKYMRNLFDFYGIQTPKRKEIYKEFLKEEKKNKQVDWQFLDKCYEDNHRELLLEKIIVNNLGSSEFFINKAIGWSLRDYSKTNPEWVRSFVDRHRGNMDKLSIREASKYI